MTKINSRDKGIRGENYVAKMLTRLGYPAERAARNGVRKGHDIICPSLYGIVHFEVKFTETIGLGTKELADAMDQAFDAAPETVKVVCVVWKRNRGPICLTFMFNEINACPTIAGEKDIGEWLEHVAPGVRVGNTKEGAK